MGTGGMGEMGCVNGTVGESGTDAVVDFSVSIGFVSVVLVSSRVYFLLNKLSKSFLLKYR